MNTTTKMNRMAMRIGAFAALVLSLSLVGCQHEQPADVSKEPNKDTSAGPPNASPQMLEQIKQHKESGK